MRKERKKRTKIILVLCSVLFLMSVGYAAFQTNLDINGTSNITNNWDIEITNVTAGKATGTAENVNTPTWDSLTAYMEANLYEKGDAMEYEITIQNKGSLDARLDSITKNIKTNNDAIKISFEGYTKGERLYSQGNDGDTKRIIAKIEYNQNFDGEIDPNQSSEVSLTLNYIQAEGKEGTDVPAPNTYLVNYDCTTNGGESCTEYNEYLKEGDKVNLNYTPKGDNFLGWSPTNDANNILNLTEDYLMQTESITLYAMYETTNIIPTFEENINDDKTIVTITYPEGCGDKYICKYQKNEETEVTVTTTTADVEFTKSGVVVATIEANGKTSSSSYTVEFINNNVNEPFEYKSNVQTYIVPETGEYKLEVWGAQGGTGKGTSGRVSGGKGGYSYGNITLSKGTKLFVYVGGKGKDGSDAGSKVSVDGGFNGGGSAFTSNANSFESGSGGGATDIRIGTDSLYSRVIVAGGGGGHSDGGNNKCVPGVGGGTSGTSATGSNAVNATGGSQTGVGSTGYSSSSGNYVNFVGTYTTNPAFGIGGAITGDITNNVYGAGGGGGWYGGGGAIWRAAAGGSGYVYTESTASNYPTGCLLNSSHYLKDAETIAGDQEFPSPTGDKETGHSGDGYAKITFVGSGGNQRLSLDLTATSNSITAVASENLNNISKYEFKINDGEWIDNGTNNTYTFTNLTQATDYNITIRATHPTGTIKKSMTATTQSIEMPVFEETINDDKTIVSITYPEGCGNKYTCKYIKGDIETIVTTQNTDVEFIKSGVVVATVSDGTNTESSSYTVEFINNNVNEPFEYKSNVQTYTIPETGEYKLEVWGAQGGQGGPSNLGGKGGYSVGTISLNKDDKLYIYTGGEGLGSTTSTASTGEQAGGFNGGGSSYQNGTPRGSGGGASDIRVNNDSLYARVIVAGGGGGNLYYNTQSYTAGVGGGSTGGNGNSGHGGTQNAAGEGNINYTIGGFGYGGYRPSTINNTICGGGGGWYGGGSGNAAGGGSGYVYTESTASNYPSGCLLNSSHYLKDAETIAGNQEFPSPTGGTETGHSGNGYAKITAFEKKNPHLKITTSSTNNSITAVASGNLNNISKYEFKINDGEWIDNGTNNTYTFTNLTQATNYNITIRATHPNGTIKKAMTATTQSIEMPVFEETINDDKTIVSITYPEGCGSKYTCKYKKDSENEVTVTTKTVDVNFTATGTIVATITGGEDTVSDSYSVEVFKLSLSATPGTSKIILTANPSAGSEVSTYEFSQDGNTYTNNGTNNVYTFTGLTHNQSYTLYVKGTTKSGKTKTAQITTSTTEIGTPTYSEADTDDGKTITITYPNGCTDYTCEYSKDSGATWTNVISNTIDVPFTESGTLVARVTDKGNTSNIVTASTYTVEIGNNPIELSEPTIEIEEVNTKTTITTESNGTYQWTETNGVWKSGGYNVNSAESNLSFKFNLTKSTNISFDWSVSSESTNYDYVYYTIYKNGSAQSGTGTSTKIGGTSYGTVEASLTYNKVTKTLDAGEYEIKFTYHKDGSVNKGLDAAYVKNFTIDGGDVYTKATITYPSGCKNGVYCSYNLNGTETQVNNNQVELNITEDTKIIAKTTYETQEKTTIKTIDSTPPLVSLSTSSTTKSITTVANATDNVSDITKYEFSINDGQWIDNGTNNSYVFNSLTNDQEYTIKVRVTNSSDLTTTESTTETLKALEKPTYSEAETSNGKTITITYPKGCGSTYTCSYTKNNGSEVPVTTQTVDVNFTDDGTLSGKVSDNVNTPVSSSYNVKMVDIALSTSATSNSITVTATPASGTNISKYEFSQDGSSYTNNGTNNTYTFTELTHDTEYTLYVRTTTTTGKTKTFQATQSTVKINKPTFRLTEGTSSSTVTITYPSGCGSKYTCKYKKDSGNEVTVTSTTASVNFTANGNVVATITDGKNIISDSYSVEVIKVTLSTSATSNSITVTAAPASGTNISKYEFSQNGTSYTNNGTDNVYTFTGLTHNKSYTLYTKVTTTTGKTKTFQTTNTTTKIDTPTYSETDTDGGKTVTITYPNGCTDYTCEYSLDGTAWTNVTTNTIDILFTKNGSVIARVTDKGNTSNIVTASSYSVEFAPLTIQDLKSLAVTTGAGLYADEYEEGRYVYKGNLQNNYITFNGEKAGWRIIAIEPDETLKIMKSLSSITMPSTTCFDPGYTTEITGITSKNSTTGTRYSSKSTDYCYASSASSYQGCSVWGSKTTMLDTSEKNITTMKRIGSGTAYNLPATEAYLNTYLNNTWYNSLKEEEKNIIVEHTWNVGVIGRFNSSFEQDLAQESSYKWKGKVGLMSITDFVKATTDTNCGNVYAWTNNGSNNYNTCKNNNWLNAAANGARTITPYVKEASTSASDYYYTWSTTNNGYIGYNAVYNAGTNKPVVFLSADIKLRGTGTSKDPYTIVIESN